MKKKAAKIFTAFIMAAIIAQGTVMVASAAKTDSTPTALQLLKQQLPTVQLWRAVPIQLLSSRERIK